MTMMLKGLCVCYAKILKNLITITDTATKVGHIRFICQLAIFVAMKEVLPLWCVTFQSDMRQLTKLCKS